MKPFLSSLGAAASLVLLLPSPASAASKDEIAFNNAALCTAYYTQAADVARENGDDSLAHLEWMVDAYNDVVKKDGAKLGKSPELIDSSIFTMSMTLMTQMSVLTPDGFTKFDASIVEHCENAMPEMDGEFTAFVWPGNMSGEVKKAD